MGPWRNCGPPCLRRQAQIRLILDYSEAQLAYFHGQEKDGKMSRSEAQQRAREAIGAQRKGDDYIFVRSIADDVMVVYSIVSRVGKVDLGAKLPDGRTTSVAYKEALAVRKMAGHL